MTGGVRAGLAVAVGVLALCLTPAAPAAQSKPAAPSVVAPPSMTFVVDTSSSMGETDTKGVHKLEAAQTSLLNVIRSAATPRQPIGLWTYPSANQDCGSGQLIRQPVSGGKEELDANIRALRPAGNTPTAAALRDAVAAIRATGGNSGTLILVSDGESNCTGDPCDAAKSITQQGFQLQVHAVGFSISDKGRRELECISSATNGRYFDVAEGDQLGTALRDVTTPALQLSVAAPDTSAPLLTAPVTATVTNPGVTDALDVVLALQVTAIKANTTTGYVAVSSPVLRTGNLAAGANAVRSWSVPIPPNTAADGVRLKISASSVDSPPAISEHTISLRASATKDDLGPLLKPTADTGTVAILGDSFASGEGAGGYANGSDTDANMCHRSPQTWGKDLFGDRRRIIACSGAVLNDLDHQQWKGNGSATKPQPTQLSQLRAVAADTELVLLSLGGNDINFAGIVGDCALPGECDPFNATLEENFESLRRRLPEAYRTVDATVNNADAIDKRNGRPAPIIVAGYPSPVSIQDIGDCPHLTRKEADRGDRLVRELNGVLATAVAAARETGANVFFAEDIVDAFRPDHTLCSKDRYVVSIRAWDALTNGGQKQEMMHPNERGYQAMTGALVRWSQRPVPPVPNAAPTDVRVLDGEPSGSAEATAAGDNRIAGQAITVHANGFAPNIQATLAIHSTPRTLTTTYPADDGTVTFTATIPATLPPGQHKMVINGFDPDGRPRQETIPIDVRTPMPWWSHGFLAAGAASVLVTGFLGLRVRRRSQQIKGTP